ncbi:hypothetical protein BDP27DRAFT_1324597, partial [Rhodocollybia butyracea]
MLGNWGPKASWYLLRYVRTGLISSHFNSHNISSKLAKQSSFCSLAPSRSNSRHSGGFALYKTHCAFSFRHVGAQEYTTFRRRSVNWRKREIPWGLVAGFGAFGYYIYYYELSRRWPGYLLRNLDESKFPSVNWDSPLETVSYLRDLDYLCFRYGDQMIRQPLVAISQETKTIQEILQAIDFFLRLSREDLERIVKFRVINVQEVEIDSIVSRLVTSQFQMHKTMKEVAHQVHSLLDHPPRWESRTLGYDLREIARVVLKANYTLLGLAMEHSTKNMLTHCHLALTDVGNEGASNAIKIRTED